MIRVLLTCRGWVIAYSLFHTTHLENDILEKVKNPVAFLIVLYTKNTESEQNTLQVEILTINFFCNPVNKIIFLVFLTNSKKENAINS